MIQVWNLTNRFDNFNWSNYPPILYLFSFSGILTQVEYLGSFIIAHIHFIFISISIISTVIYAPPSRTVNKNVHKLNYRPKFEMQFSIVKNKNTFLKNCCFCCNMKRSNLRKTLSTYLSHSLSISLFKLKKQLSTSI